MQIFNLEIIGQVTNSILMIALTLYAVFIIVFVFVEKNRLIREALCNCGKLAIVGFIGAILSALFTNMLYGGTIRILLDLGIGVTFFFLTLILAGIGCVITSIYHCKNHDC